MIEHTDGIWSIAMRFAETVIQDECTGCIAVIPSPDASGHGLVNADERAANARLIAAAPDLAESVRKAEQLAEVASDWHLTEVEVDGDMVGIHDLIAEFRAALSKTQGEPQ